MSIRRGTTRSWARPSCTTPTTKCTVYFQEVKRIGWPVPHTLVDEDCQEVVYIDHDHLHMVGDVDTGCDANF